MRDQFIQRLSEHVAKEKDILLVTGDLGFGVFNKFREDFPENFINAGVAEQNMTGMATGLALAGKRVITYSIGNFCTLRCLEQIRNDACYHDANVKVVSIGGGFSYGPLGVSHHATEDLSIMRALPNLVSLAPCGYWETREATSAMLKTPGTFYLRLDKSYGEDSPRDPSEKFEVGKARVLEQGDDCTIFVSGGILEEVLKVHSMLKDRGIQARVVSMHTISPIDKNAILDAVKTTQKIFTVEENTILGGLGSAVAEVVVDSGVYPKTFQRFGLQAEFSSIVGSQQYLRKCYELDSETIFAKILKSL
ncbi:MAG: hypothetical protein KDD33_07310 [Bdellovibrionales bacterium]|nr:hypothetical protein [Bdellovibrionales bacterium]